MSPPSVGRLDRAVDASRDHVLGPVGAPITLVEYGSYDCPHCRAANERISELRDRFGERLCYVFQHLPPKVSRQTLASAAERCDRNTHPHAE